MDCSDSDTDSYAGSAASVRVQQEDSEATLANQIEKVFDPLPFDRAIVVETRHSGLINALSRDLVRLKQESQILVDKLPEDLAKWNSLLKKSETNVQWLKTRVGQLVAKEKAAAPIEYAQAESQIIFREDV